ncbi:DUF397 domain-containing protein [Nocardia sp. NPDC005998]
MEVTHPNGRLFGVHDSKNPTAPALIFTPPNGTPSPLA